jgi:hypothetical protein
MPCRGYIERKKNTFLAEQTWGVLKTMGNGVTL